MKAGEKDKRSNEKERWEFEGGKGKEKAPEIFGT